MQEEISSFSMVKYAPRTQLFLRMVVDDDDSGGGGAW